MFTTLISGVGVSLPHLRHLSLHAGPATSQWMPTLLAAVRSTLTVLCLDVRIGTPPAPLFDVIQWADLRRLKELHVRLRYRNDGDDTPWCPVAPCDLVLIVDHEDDSNRHLRGAHELHAWLAVKLGPCAVQCTSLCIVVPRARPAVLRFRVGKVRTNDEQLACFLNFCWYQNQREVKTTCNGGTTSGTSWKNTPMGS